MNISSHVFLPTTWKLGVYTFDGSRRSNSSFSRTHWFPINTSGFHLRYLIPNAESRFGNSIGFFIGSSTYTQTPNNFLYQSNSNVYDAIGLAASIPFTYIIY